MIKLGRMGADVHYASTMPEFKRKNSKITTSKIGEISGLKNIYCCDPSRLSYLSSLPHTFTSMAISDSCMPEIIKKCEKA